MKTIFTIRQDYRHRMHHNTAYAVQVASKACYNNKGKKELHAIIPSPSKNIADKMLSILSKEIKPKNLII